MKRKTYFALALLLFVAVLCPAEETATKVETGEINGSYFRIDMPANYNGSLVMYCHGYGGDVKYGTKPPRESIRIFTDAGYAVAQAGYAGSGWAVKEAIHDTESLRRYFISKYGKPKHTYVTGHSMGGIITLAIIEKFPDSYDAALPICGPLAPSLEFIQRRSFDLLVVFDYYYPGVIGSPVNISEKVRMNKEYLAELGKILDADPQKRAAMLKFAGFATEKELPIGIAFFAGVQRELMKRAGGNPFDNRNTIYTGGADDVAINRGVKRYPADPRAVQYLREYYTPSGRPIRPILAIHTVYDPIVPAWTTDEYDALVREHGDDAFFVQRYTAHPGHCGVKPEETWHAFEDLVKWVDTGQRPKPGEQK